MDVMQAGMNVFGESEALTETGGVQRTPFGWIRMNYFAGSRREATPTDLSVPRRIPVRVASVLSPFASSHATSDRGMKL